MMLSMPPRLAAALAFAFLPLAMPTARADLSLSGHSTVFAMSMQGSGYERLWLENTLLRRDLLDRGKAYSNLYDFKKRVVTLIDHSQRVARVYNLAAMQAAQTVDTKIDEDAITMKLEPTGRTHELQAWPCAEHTLRLSMPAEIDGEKLVFDMQGTVWLARKAPELKEVAAMLKLIRSPEFFVGIPALIKSAPVHARGISEATRRLAPQGLLCSVDVRLGYSGAGRIAQLSQKLASRISLTFDSYSTDPIPKDTFTVPAGYRVEKHAELPDKP